MIETNINDGVYTIKINRPEARNAANSHIREGLVRAFQNPPEGTRLVKWIGTKEAFCSGQDLSEVDDKTDIRAVIVDEYKPILDAIEALDVPLIAGVEGACAGAGVSLALAADVVVAKESAFFQVAFSRIGLVPDILLTYTLPRLIGSARAMGMALTGDRIGAQTAQDWGLIWRSFPDEQFDQKLDDLCAEISKGASYALGMTRQMLRQSWKNPAEDQLMLEAKNQVLASQSHDFREGIQAFLEKRTPKFEGK